MSRAARLEPIDLPEFGTPSQRPMLPERLYPQRLERLRARARAAGFDYVLVYADREHSANLSYLTGFDPRFEEALLVVSGEGEPAILVGNECFGIAGAAPLPMRRHLYQDFSLPSQPRDRSVTLTEILVDEGLSPESRVGLVGWKVFSDPSRIDVPSFITDEVRKLTGTRVESATGLLMDAGDGLRVINEVEQVAWFEYAACHTSEAVKRVVFGLEPGMTEAEAVQLLGWNGLPLSCHLMLTAGPRASHGLLSPADRPIERGDRFTVAYGVWGALNCRAGFVVAGASELPAPIGDYLDRLVGPYFEAIVEWYLRLRVGEVAGSLHEAIAARLGDPFFGIFLNPGHQIHFDEWVNSPVTPHSTIPLRSGMALQVDVIPATGTDYFTTNIEDGVVLADAPLREELESGFPEAWHRIEARREFMADVLGIELHPDVLPLSNIPAYLPPFLLQPGSAMTVKG